MMALTYILVTLVILALCALGLSVGLLLRNKALQSCGRIVTPSGEEVSCPICTGKDADCKLKKYVERHAHPSQSSSSS